MQVQQKALKRGPVRINSYPPPPHPHVKRRPMASKGAMTAFVYFDALLRLARTPGITMHEPHFYELTF